MAVGFIFLLPKKQQSSIPLVLQLAKASDLGKMPSFVLKSGVLDALFVVSISGRCYGFYCTPQ